MNREDAISAIGAVFNAYRKQRSPEPEVLSALEKGKLYELLVLSDLVKELAARRFALFFAGSRLCFKGAPGKIQKSDSHFEVRDQDGITILFRIFVDIEFRTMSSCRRRKSDLSLRHELDIVVTTAVADYPFFDEIAYGVECKCVANFTKRIVKEVLGVRRELCDRTKPTPSTLSQAGAEISIMVPAKPPSEFRLAYIDPRGNRYRLGPEKYGIEFKHLEP